MRNPVIRTHTFGLTTHELAEKFSAPLEFFQQLDCPDASLGQEDRASRQYAALCDCANALDHSGLFFELTVDFYQRDTCTYANLRVCGIAENQREDRTEVDQEESVEIYRGETIFQAASRIARAVSRVFTDALEDLEEAEAGRETEYALSFRYGRR